MKKYIVIVTVLLVLSWISAPTYALEKPDNPGYLKSPLTIMIGGTQIYSMGDTSRDNSIRPFLLGMFNLVQSEYGNISLSTAAFYQTPHRNYTMENSSFKVKSDLLTGELGLNYTTGSRGMNIFFGAGYNWTLVQSKMEKLTYNGTGSDFSKTFNKTVRGWQYYIGFQYFVVDNWGVFFLFRGQTADRVQYSVDQYVAFNNGNSEKYKADFNKNISNKTYTVGFTYTF